MVQPKVINATAESDLSFRRRYRLHCILIATATLGIPVIKWVLAQGY